MEDYRGEKWKEQSEHLRGRPSASTQQSLASGVIWSFISREARSACRDRIPCPDPAEHRQEGTSERGRGKELNVWKRKQKQKQQQKQIIKVWAHRAKSAVLEKGS